jgi:Uma2 family endonuclease
MGAPATEAARGLTRPGIPGRAIYRLTADQVLGMVAAGIIPEGAHAELLDGVLYEMTKGELHNVIVTAVADLLRPLVALAPDRHHLRVECSNTADPYSLPEPDVAVVRGGLYDYLPAPPPLERLSLVVEINHNSPEDHTVKLAKYARAGVPVYWVVDVEARQVTVYTEPNAAGGYDRRVTLRPGQALDVVIGGHRCGAVRVEDVFPPAGGAGP